MKKGEISKGFSSVPDNIHLNKDCKFCASHMFDGCIDSRVNDFDVVTEFGRTYCNYFKDRK